MVTINLADMGGDLSFEHQNLGKDLYGVVSGQRGKKIYFVEIITGRKRPALAFTPSIRREKLHVLRNES
jgi:hypothetical protein